MTRQMNIPSTLPVFALHNRILFPSLRILLNISIPKSAPSSPDSITLFEKLHELHSKSNNANPPLVACIPLLDNSLPKPKSPSVDLNELAKIGCAAKIVKFIKSSTAAQVKYILTLEGVTRIKVDSIAKSTPHVEVNVTPIALYEQATPLNPEFKSAVVGLRNYGQYMTSLLPLPSALQSQLRQVISSAPPSQLCDLLVSTLDTVLPARTKEEIEGLSWDDRLKALTTVDLPERVEHVRKMIQAAIKFFETRKDSNEGRSIAEMIFNPFSSVPRRVESAKPTNTEDDDDELAEMEEKLKKVDLSPEALKVAERTIKRLKNMQPMHAEYQIHLHHLQWLLALPWNIYTEDSIDLLKAKEELDRDHCGLQKIKSRVLEFLAVRKLALSMENLVENSVQTSQQPSEASSQEAADSTVGETEALDPENSQKQAPPKPPKPYKGPILCFVGPPGVGKTSIAQSIAKATNRKFHRVALGGVRDEAEIRGHRRTYIGALPGVIVTALRSIQTSNPVVLLDEVDKLTRDFRGDPAAALLEVLDPEQNHSFTDHFLGVPFDLSHIMWICTANGLDGIPKPLIDRMEIIHLPGYTPAEKIQITQSHLIPKQIRLHHLPASLVPEFTYDIVSKIIHGYALREAGVRGMEKLIAKICRALVVRLVRLREVNKNSDDAIVKLDWAFIRKVLGPERYHPEIAKELSPGVSIGLAYTGSGAGSILYIETTTHPGNGKIHLTGSLGTVMLESVQIALSVLRSHAYRLNLTSTPQSLLFSNRDIHVHFPSGATPKDGPSAGVAIFLALFSNASGKKCKNIGVTGELNLRGQVEPVGGIEEKVGAAKRSGINMVLIPKGNKSEWESRKEQESLANEVWSDSDESKIKSPLSKEDDIQVGFIETVWDALAICFEELQVRYPSNQQQSQGDQINSQTSSSSSSSNSDSESKQNGIVIPGSFKSKI